MAEDTESLSRIARLRRRLHPTNRIDRKRWWEVANLWWNLTIKGVLGLTAILAFVVIMHLFYGVLFQEAVVIEPISVPKDIQEKNGYTPNVAALHLRDALNKYAERAHTSATGSELLLHGDLTDFVLPTVGLSFEAVVAQIRTFFRLERRQNISGEIMFVDGKLTLRLRKNGMIIHESREGVDAKGLEVLFADAAPDVFAVTDPYFEAAAKSDENPEAAFESAKKIIADRPSSDWNVVWAHNLLGLLLYKKHKLDEETGGAIAEFKWAIEHDPDFAIAHLNLGLAYNEQGRIYDAINEFRSAIRIDPDLGTARVHLGDALEQIGEVEDAGCEYREAIAKFHQAVVSNPLSAALHQRLAATLKKR